MAHVGSKIDLLKEVVRAQGLEPERVLLREALSEPHMTYAEQIRILGLVLRDSLRNELLAIPNPSGRYATGEAQPHLRASQSDQC
jgi:hypothetical protein